MVLLVVLWRLRDQLRLRDLAELFLPRGVVSTHEAAREWAARGAPLLSERLRAKRHGQAGASWYVAETYVKVHGAWCSLCRAIERGGTLVVARRGETRDMTAARRFLRQAAATVGQRPGRATTDGPGADPRAIREALGSAVAHRCTPRHTIGDAGVQ